MTYSLTLNKYMSDPKYINGIKTWKEVTDCLKYDLGNGVISVHIYKYSSDGRCLGSIGVNMGNFWNVVTETKDKNVLL